MAENQEKTPNLYSKVLELQKDGNIYVTVEYKNKDKLKELKFRWSPEKKLWYKPVDLFTADIFNKIEEMRLLQGVQITYKVF